MECLDYQKRIPAFLNEDMGEEELKRFREHLGCCAQCRRQVNLYERSWDMLGEWKEIDPEPGYVSRFWLRLARERPWYLKFKDWAQEWFAVKKLAPVLLPLGVVLVVGFFTVRTQMSLRGQDRLVSALSKEDLEFVRNIELAETLDILMELELLRDLDIIMGLNGWGA